MPMSRADYTEIALALRNLKPDPKGGTVGEKRLWTRVVRDLTDALANRSGNFDGSRFQQACGFPVE